MGVKPAALPDLGLDWKRFLVPTIVFLVVLGVAASSLHGYVEAAIRWGGNLISGHSKWGAVAFVVIGALSTMLAFFSSVVIIPVAVDQWGVPLTTALLLLGCTLGGCAAYSIGRFLGARIARRFIPHEQMEYYEQRISRHAKFPVVLVFQLALPSEIPGYVLGTVRYRFLPYLLALLLAEFPYVVGTVLIGAGFLERNYGLMVAVGIVGLGLVTWAVQSLRRSIKA